MQEQSCAFQVDCLFEAAEWAELPSVGLRTPAREGSPGSREACGPRDSASTGAERERRSGALWEVAPTWRSEHRIKADAAQDWKWTPFLVIAACPQRCDADG